MTDERQNLPSGSGWRGFELCVGKFQLEQEAKRLNQEAHVYSLSADSGLRMHARLAPGGEKIELSETETQSVAFVDERAAEQVERIFQGQQYTQLREQRLWLHLDGKPAMSARFDVVSYTPELALVQDYKFGFHEPDPAEDNAQLKVLAVLIALNLPTVKEVVVQLVSGPFGVTEYRMGISELMLAYDDIIKTLKAINAEDPPLTPGVEQCKYCRASNICPALRKLSAPVSKFSLTKLPEDSDRSGKLLDEIEVLENAFEEIKAFYYNQLSNDPAAKITGYELVPNAPRREISDVQAAKSRLAEFLDDGELNTAMDLKVGQVEKLFGKKVGLKGKDLREKFNAVMKDVIVEKEPKPSLKRVSGKPKLLGLDTGRTGQLELVA